MSSDMLALINRVNALLEQTTVAPIVVPTPAPTGQRMTIAGRMMPTNRPASRAQIARIEAHGAERITEAALKIGLSADAIRNLNVADASDLFQTLEGRSMTIATMHTDAIPATIDSIEPSMEWKGYAEGDTTSLWIERMESQFA
jgi:hypothetical protein